MIPYNFFSPTIEVPLSGNVDQSISPSFSYDYARIPEIEYEITTQGEAAAPSPGLPTDRRLCEIGCVFLKFRRLAGIKRAEQNSDRRSQALPTKTNDNSKNADTD